LEDAAPTELGVFRRLVLQIFRAYGAKVAMLFTCLGIVPFVCENKHMKSRARESSNVIRHRKNLKGLVSRLEKRPFDFLPERSVECLNQFLNGYQIFGPALWRDLTSFQFWLQEQIFYPEDSGATWWRFIQLNGRDRCDSFDLFCKLYRQYSRNKPIDVQPAAPEITPSSKSFDFHSHLYAISKKPGLYIGNSSGDVTLVAGYLAGYFTGKKVIGAKLTPDERKFLQFGRWLRKHHKFAQTYPWYRLVEMWPRARDSFQSFFVEYDAFLTDFGKKTHGLEDLFEFVTTDRGTTCRRREKLPNEITVIPNSPMWWRAQRR
jgi:hypothetical protein